MLCDRYDDDLHGSDGRRKHKTVIVAVSHDYAADETGGNAPRGLKRELAGIVLVGKLDVEGARKAVAEEVACSCLKCLAVMHERFDAVCGNGARKFVAFGLFAFENGHRQ